MKPIAFISEKIVNILSLDIPSGAPVYIGESNIEHIRKRHPYEYEKYFPDIGTIISFPDYVGQSPRSLLC